ncbi:MAG TPA: PDZ domain-containing protein [Allosphingosinicella sp.]|nr:PDZ domain-containing protein [Allosphingosinicella sp.]
MSGQASSAAEPAAPPAADVVSAADYRADALAIESLINRHYAYLDRFEGGKAPIGEPLRAEAASVADRRALLRYAERALLALADHHAITGASFADSWAVVPSYSDLWIVRAGDFYVVEAVREGSPAAAAGVRIGDRLTDVAGVPTAQAVSSFWADLGLPVTQERASFAARVLAAGRRDRPRALGFRSGDEAARQLVLPNLYTAAPAGRPPLTASHRRGRLTIRINNSLGDSATIAAFDSAMAQAKAGDTIVIDLRDTPGGGNTMVARAMMGWFVDRPRAYQVHNLPAEARETGVARQWIEQVLPRRPAAHKGLVRVLAGRWTGSMGEGLAIGFDALGAKVSGGRMAGLLGAVYDHRLEHSGLVLKLPSERLMATDLTPREDFVAGARR